MRVEEVDQMRNQMGLRKIEKSVQDEDAAIRELQVLIRVELFNLGSKSNFRTNIAGPLRFQKLQPMHSQQDIAKSVDLQ
jgi:hypothetical protein